MSGVTTVIGGKGSIGRRYVAILQYLRESFKVVDEPIDAILELPECDRVIIASPTETHYEYAKACISQDIPFLCEKPLSKSVEECAELAELQEWNAYVVCNYKYLMKQAEKPRLAYDYFHAGKDELEWDCCQILYLDPYAKIARESPIWNFSVNACPVSYRELERSYIEMIQDFLTGCYGRNLWTLDDGLKMTEAVWRRIGA